MGKFRIEVTQKAKKDMEKHLNQATGQTPTRWKSFLQNCPNICMKVQASPNK